MYSLEMTSVAVSDFTEEFLSKIQNVETDKIMEYCNSISNSVSIINDSATESVTNVKNGMRTMIAKFIGNVFEEDEVDKTPMMIDLVVRNILKYMSLKDLSSCRQVCKLWDEEASLYIRQKQQRIIFYPESKDKISTFTQFVRNSQKWKFYQGPPFSTYCFTAQFPTTQFSPALMKDFVSNCGQYVRKLEIFYPDDGQLSSHDFKAFLLNGMNNLETIHFINLPHALTQSSFLSQTDKDLNKLNAVTHLRIDRTWQLETCWAPSFLTDLLSLMPNLEDYELWTWNSTSEDEHSEPYIVSLSPQNVNNIQTLRPGSIGDKLGLTIANLGLCLTKLYLPVLNRNVNADTIERLLQSQRECLKEFQLNCSTMKDERLLRFPKMEKLIFLHIIITHPWKNDYTTFNPPLDYNSYFPKIKTLRVELAIYNDSNFIKYFFPQRQSGNWKMECVTLQELDISFSGFRDEKFIPIVAALFPNVRKLKLDGYGCRIFSNIFAYMQQLEVLELYMIYGFNVDDQMTGIGKEECGKLRLKKKGKYDVETLTQVNPSLCNLKQLCSLSIRQKDYQAKFWPDAQCITNITALVALAKMTNLRYLHIESVKFTQDCLKLLRNALEDCWLDFV